MVMDLAVELIHATVQLEQPLGDGTRTVGTGFLISAPGADGKPRTVLITANHVFQKMQHAEARIGYRISNADGSWSYSPKPLKIRDKDGGELWTHHPSRSSGRCSPCRERRSTPVAPREAVRRELGLVRSPHRPGPLP